MPPRLCRNDVETPRAAGTIRPWPPRLEEINREARQFGVGVQGGVEQVALRARMHHEAKNWLIHMDCFNAFDTVKRTAVLTEAATCVPALTPFVAKCYGQRSAPVFFQMGSGERSKIDCSNEVQYAMGSGVIQHAAPAGTEADPRGVRTKRCRSLPGRCQHRNG